MVAKMSQLQKYHRPPTSGNREYPHQWKMRVTPPWELRVDPYSGNNS